MIGLVSFGLLALYIWFCIRLTRWASRQAKDSSRPGWHYGLPTALLSFGILFWDWLPTLVVHQYNCATKGGFYVYKTLDQWKAETPGIAKQLEPVEGAPSITKGNTTIYPLNQRFNWEITIKPHLFGIKERNERIVDNKTHEILAIYIDFNSDIGGDGIALKQAVY